MKDFAAELRQLAQDGLLRLRRRLDGPQENRVQVNGESMLAFCSNDYLGLANHPALIDAACEGARRYGVGAGASHLITGHSAAHEAFETRFAEFTGLPAALLYANGYLANLGIVAALLGRHDTLFLDRLAHASLYDAAQLSRARLERFAHNDLADLEARLAASSSPHRLVAVDAVYSMDGDLAPLPELLALCEQHDAWLLVDDAHGFGIQGEGRGSLARFRLHSSRLIYLATLGKAAGVSGACVAGESDLIGYLLQKSRPYIYTTAAPPLLAHALLTSLDLIAAGDDRRRTLQQNIARLRSGLAALRWPLLPSDTPIQPLIIGAAQDAVQLADRLYAEGILVPAIRPPTVPEGSARLRISLSALHTAEDIDRLSETLHALAR